MKRIIYLLILQLFFVQAYSQQVKQGTTFNYTFNLHGQTVPIEFSVLRFTDTLTLGWKIRGLATGTYTMVPTALQHGDKMNFIQPVAGGVIQLGEHETFFLISTDAFGKLVKDHQFMYDNTVYDFKDDSLIAGQKVLHVTAKDETTEWWILNDPGFPLVCKIQGSPFGINCLLNSVK
ncbi:hypothetical protein SAMN05518672_1011073 [Chitinophaga sp. CF118]|uniref:hypothetical protein n=1 Tax=Chitinophaga sp. CF118 TaxID=1884367 RepID=UPI0008EAFBC8|nr:hypothetical protein [Chitinophaga sp. CF118]SFD21283.1 hypothetical protein SAMN05518672_1011073 [Chitinophaga sp. CF118]